MRPLFVVREVSADPLRHREDDTAIIHVQPKTRADKLVVGIARERTVKLATKAAVFFRLSK